MFVTLDAALRTRVATLQRGEQRSCYSKFFVSFVLIVFNFTDF